MNTLTPRTRPASGLQKTFMFWLLALFALLFSCDDEVEEKAKGPDAGQQGHTKK